MLFHEIESNKIYFTTVVSHIEVMHCYLDILVDFKSASSHILKLNRLVLQKAGYRCRNCLATCMYVCVYMGIQVLVSDQTFGQVPVLVIFVVKCSLLKNFHLLLHL